MERRDIIERLNDLIQLDVDAVEAYDHAIKHMEYADIRKRFLDFQDDHKTHISELSAFVQQLDGKPIKPKPDLRGYLLEVFTALRSVTSTQGALEAMKRNETLTNEKYREAADLDLPEEFIIILRTNLSQEIRHLQYIEEILDNPRRDL